MNLGIRIPSPIYKIKCFIFDEVSYNDSFIIICIIIIIIISNLIVI